MNPNRYSSSANPSTSCLCTPSLYEQKGMADATLRAARASGSGRFMWCCVRSHVANGQKHPSSDYFTTLASPDVAWNDKSHNANTITAWAAAASVVPCMEEVGRSVVDALLRIASWDSLRPHVPTGI